MNEIRKGGIVMSAYKDKDGRLIIDKIAYKVVSEKRETSPMKVKLGYEQYFYSCVPLDKVGSDEEKERTRGISESSLHKVSKAREFDELRAEVEKQTAYLYSYASHNFLRPQALVDLLDSYDFKAKAKRLQRLYDEVREEISAMFEDYGKVIF